MFYWKMIIKKEVNSNCTYLGSLDGTKNSCDYLGSLGSDSTNKIASIFCLIP
jgi:hypothetical protein